MKKRVTYRACLLMVAFCATTFSQGHSLDRSGYLNISIVQTAQLATEELIPGEPKAGSIPAASPGNSILGETQYTVQYPGGGTKLVLEFLSDSVSFYVRRNLPITMEGNKILADFGPFGGGEHDFPYYPPLGAATYFIAVYNSVSRAINFTVTASLVGPPTADTIDVSFPDPLVFDRLELGSVPAPEPNTCALGRTQYTISLADSSYCDWGTGWLVALRGDQNLNLYVRNGQRVAVEDGKVVADFASKPPTGNGVFSVFSSNSPTPAVRTYFIAVENCNASATNYSLVFVPRIPDLPPPSITSLSLNNSKLIVRGYFLASGSTVLIDGEPQRTKYGGQVFGGIPIAEDILIAKGARKKIPRGVTVEVTVNIGSCTTRPARFTRPAS